MLSPLSNKRRQSNLELNNLDLSDSKSIEMSSCSNHKISEFPNVSISVHSSYDKSDVVAYIQGKNIEIFQALSSKVSKLKQNSEKILFSCLEDQSYERNQSERCPSCAANSFDTKNSNLESLRKFVHEVKTLKSTFNNSSKSLKQEMESIKKINEENEILKLRLEEITTGLGKSLLDSNSESAGCSCSIY